MADPIVNFGTNYDEIMNGSVSVSVKRRIGTEILDALQNKGYVHLQNFADIRNWIKEYCANGEAFLALPQETKDKYKWSLKTFSGYARNVDECPKSDPIPHETIDVTVVEQTPSEIENFKKNAQFGKNILHALARVVFASLELALGYEENFFNGKINFDCYVKNMSILRYVSYPPIGGSEKSTQRWITHKDFSAITFTFENENGGYEIKARGKDWQTVNPNFANSVILIAGGQMEPITKGRILPAENRIVTRNKSKSGSNIVFYTGFDVDELLLAPNEEATDETETVTQFADRVAPHIYKSADCHIGEGVWR